MNRFLLALFVASASGASMCAQITINMTTLIQETRAIASRVETSADVLTVAEQTMNDIPNKILAFIPATVATGKDAGDMRDLTNTRFGIELTAAEIDALKRGSVPVRIRVAMQARIPDLIRSIKIVDVFLKNIRTTLLLLQTKVVPAAQPYLHKDLQNAVAQAIAFGDEHSAELQAISDILRQYTALLATMLNSIENLNDALFRNKMVDAVRDLQNKSKALFDNNLRPFILKYQGALFDVLIGFKGVRFTVTDGKKVMNAVRSQMRNGT